MIPRVTIPSNSPSKMAHPLQPLRSPGVGAIIEVTPDLATACEAVAKTLRGKAEALEFLMDAQKNAHAAASSIITLARNLARWWGSLFQS